LTPGQGNKLIDELVCISKSLERIATSLESLQLKEGVLDALRQHSKEEARIREQASHEVDD